MRLVGREGTADRIEVGSGLFGRAEEGDLAIGQEYYLVEEAEDSRPRLVKAAQDRRSPRGNAPEEGHDSQRRRRVCACINTERWNRGGGIGSTLFTRTV